MSHDIMNSVKIQLPKKLFDPYRFVVLLLLLVSICANIFFYNTLASKSIGFGDSWARINIARRIVDSLTPGIAQLGGIWLPFPQLLFVPFAAIDTLYFNGIAGAFISSPAFIIGGIYLYKILSKLTRNTIISLAGVFIYATNLNLLYLQTTSMSEVLFIVAILGAIYHYIIWTQNVRKNILSLIAAAAWTFTATFTRYEGYLLFLIMAASICMTALIKTKKYRITEGITILFVTLGGLGIVLWQIYSWAIFGNPLNWYKIYTGQIAVISTINEKPKETWGITDYRGDLYKSVKSVIESTFQMNGILFTVPMLIALLLFPFRLLRLKDKAVSMTLLCIVLIASVPLLFLVLSSFKGTALVKNPPIDIRMIFDTEFYKNTEYNIRYGLTSLPFFILICALVFSSSRILTIFFSIIAVVQMYLMYIGFPTTIYSFPHRYLYVGSEIDVAAVEWFHRNYDGGLILISAIANDQLMYSFKIPYKNYIYEGTNFYWKESVKNPTKYAAWIMMQNGPKVDNTGGSADFVSYYLQDTSALRDNYNLVYKDSAVVIYKIKNNTTVSY